MVSSSEGVPKFACGQCGKCCSHMRGMISEEDKEFLRQYAFGMLPLVQIVPIDEMAFPLFDFEAKRFKEWQKDVKIDAKIKPSRVILDLESNRAIVVTYYMDYDACPFLKDNKCVLYDKYRAYICRMFPFNRGPFLKTQDELKKEDMFGSCGQVEKIIPALSSDKEKMTGQLKESLGSELLNVVEFDYLQEWVNKTIVNLIKSKKIRAAMNYPYEFLVKRIENASKIDLMDFLVEAKVHSKEDIENLIKRFDSNADAKELLAG